MAKYIDSGAFQAALVRKQCGPANQRYTDGWNDCLLRVKSMVSKAPAADVAPVIRATWVFTTDFGPSELYHCSRCGREEVRFGKSSIYKQYPYCHCGAKMDGGAEECD